MVKTVSNCGGFKPPKIVKERKEDKKTVKKEIKKTVKKTTKKK